MEQLAFRPKNPKAADESALSQRGPRTVTFALPVRSLQPEAATRPGSESYHGDDEREIPASSTHAARDDEGDADDYSPPPATQIRGGKGPPTTAFRIVTDNFGASHMIANAQIEKGDMIHIQIPRCTIALENKRHPHHAEAILNLFPAGERSMIYMKAVTRRDVDMNPVPGNIDTVVHLQHVPMLSWLCHSCAPNAGIASVVGPMTTRGVRLVAWATISAGEEITVNRYQPFEDSTWPSKNARQRILSTTYGVDNCSCALCSQDTDHGAQYAELERMRAELETMRPEVRTIMVRVEKAMAYIRAIQHIYGTVADPRIVGANMHMARACEYAGFANDAANWEGKAQDLYKLTNGL